MKYVIEGRHAIHIGKTKSYQIWKIGGEGNFVMVTQWGKVSQCRVFDGSDGQRKIHQRVSNQAQVQGDVDSEQMRRRGRNYDDWTIKEELFNSKKDFQSGLTRIMGPVNALEIMGALNGGSVPAMPDPDPVTKMPEPEKIDRSKDKNWGTW